MLAVSDSHRGSHIAFGRVAVRVANHVDRLLHAIDIDFHPPGPLRSIIGQGDVHPLTRFELLPGFNRRHTGNPASVVVPPQAAVDELHENAVASRPIGLIRKHRAAIDSLRVQPESDGETTIADQTWNVFDFEVALLADRRGATVDPTLQRSLGLLGGDSIVCVVE